MPILSWRKPKIPGAPKNFSGHYFGHNPKKTWVYFIPIENRPINYLEIGVSCGGNAIHIANSYAAHKDSKIYCVDPWFDYDEYPEYKGEQENSWRDFQRNIQLSGHFEKFVVSRGLSENIVPTFSDNFFDIIFVDGNHETKYVYNDGVMALEKVKPGGYIIFDDYSETWPQTIKGIDEFIKDHNDKIEIIFVNSRLFSQAIVRKK
jgi:predicted O-methyltransferase YrrM